MTMRSLICFQVQRAISQFDFKSKTCVISVGRSGSKWMERVCREIGINTKSNRVDIGVRVELPAEVFSHLTDELYESKIVYRTENTATACAPSA